MACLDKIFQYRIKSDLLIKYIKKFQTTTTSYIQFELVEILPYYWNQTCYCFFINTLILTGQSQSDPNVVVVVDEKLTFTSTKYAICETRTNRRQVSVSELEITGNDCAICFFIFFSVLQMSLYYFFFFGY